MTPIDLTPAERERWVRARSTFGVDLRRPDPEETMLSDDEIWHGVRAGIFHGHDPFEQVIWLEPLPHHPAPARAHFGGQP